MCNAEEACRDLLRMLLYVCVCLYCCESFGRPGQPRDVICSIVGMLSEDVPVDGKSSMVISRSGLIPALPNG